MYTVSQAGVDQATGNDVMVHPNDCMARLTRFVHEQQVRRRALCDVTQSLGHMYQLRHCFVCEPVCSLGLIVDRRS